MFGCKNLDLEAYGRLKQRKILCLGAATNSRLTVPSISLRHLICLLLVWLCCREQLDAGQMSFERTGLALQNPDIQRAVTKALAAVPRDDALIAMPRAARQDLILCVWYNVHSFLGFGPDSDGEESPAVARRRATPNYFDGDYRSEHDDHGMGSFAQDCRGTRTCVRRVSIFGQRWQDKLALCGS